jgi:hypothetical protein
MGRLKVTYAPPGTDPTRLPSDPPKLGIGETLKDNWLLLLGVAAMILFAPKVLGIGGKKEDQAAQPTAVATVERRVVEMTGDGIPASWCEFAGQVAPPGVYHIGDRIRECRGGAWYAVEVGSAEQPVGGTVQETGEVEQ